MSGNLKIVSDDPAMELLHGFIGLMARMDMRPLS